MSKEVGEFFPWYIPLSEEDVESWEEAHKANKAKRLRERISTACKTHLYAYPVMIHWVNDYVDGGVLFRLPPGFRG